jgi:hypothetical protein
LCFFVSTTYIFASRDFIGVVGRGKNDVGYRTLSRKVRPWAPGRSWHELGEGRRSWVFRVGNAEEKCERAQRGEARK